MNLSDDFNLEDSLSKSLSYEMDLGYESINSGIDSMKDNWLYQDLEDDGLFHNSLTRNSGVDISFKGHLEDLYNPEIQRAQESYDSHMSQLADASNLSDMKYHLEEAEYSKDTELYFQDCLDEARRNQAINEAHLDSITSQADIAKQYQQEIENVLYPNKYNK